VLRVLCLGINLIGVASAIAAGYLGWSLYRISPNVIMDVAMGESQWPRPWPYPDEWLARWNEQLDAQYPAQPGHIKLHAELPRMRWILGRWFALAVMTTWACMTTTTIVRWRASIACALKQCRARLFQRVAPP